MSAISLPLPPISLIKQCRTISELNQIQAQLIKSNLSSSSSSSSSSHSLVVLRRLIAVSPSHHLIFHLYIQMLCCSNNLHGLEFSLPSVLKSCGKASAFEQARQVHGQILRTRLQLDPYVSNSLLRMYFELDEFGLACRVFDNMAQRDIISWNSMVTGCLKCGRVEFALRVFEEMPEKDLVSCNSMVDGLMKWKWCDLARELFHDMAQKDVITWTTMVSGYVLNGRLEEALGVFREMLSSGVEPDAAAIVNVLSAIADLGFPEEGKWVHAYLQRSNIKLNSEVLGSALIDMYSKCGLVANAYSVFRRICDRRQVGDWNSMISGLSIHGLGREALDIFREMLAMNIEPNEITFVGILNACSHAGLLKEGKYYFELMKEKFNIEPKLQHYGCMIDLLGRAGLVDEAMRFLEEAMPMEPDAVAWKSILSACVKYSYAKHGEYAATRAVNLAPQDSSSYVLLSNMYAKLGQWEDVERVRALMRKRCVHKVPGCSMVMIKGKLHEFLVGNCSREPDCSVKAG